MDSLPHCYISKPIRDYLTSFRRRSEKDYEQLIQLIKDYLEADCWAFVINDEIIFNSYDEDKSFTQLLTERGLRLQITNNPHSSILCKINRKDEDARIDIYMFGAYSFKIQIDYNAEEQTYYARKFVSEEYENQYGSTQS